MIARNRTRNDRDHACALISYIVIILLLIGVLVWLQQQYQYQQASRLVRSMVATTSYQWYQWFSCDSGCYMLILYTMIQCEVNQAASHYMILDVSYIIYIRILLLEFNTYVAITTTHNNIMSFNFNFINYTKLIFPIFLGLL